MMTNKEQIIYDWYMTYGRWIIGWSIDLLIMIVVFKIGSLLNNRK